MAGSGITKIAGGGGGGGANTPYDNPTITNTQFGGISPGTNIGGLFVKDVVLNAAVAYLAPLFNSFLISGQSTQLEVGESIVAGAKTFNWGTTNNANISAIPDPQNLAIRDVTNSVDLANGIANNGTFLTNFASPITRTSPSNQKYRITGKNTQLNSFTRDFDVNWNWKRFYGVSGVVPVNSAQVRALPNNTFGSTFSINIPQGQTIICFAYEASRPDITNASVKYVEGFNANVGSTFTKYVFNVNDGGGNPVSYKIYVAELPGPYPENATYNVTIP